MTEATSHHTPDARPNATTRAARILAAACWPAAFAVWPLHVTHAALGGNTSSAVALTLLLAAGSAGAPAHGLRALGPRMTSATCRAIAQFCFGICALLSLLYTDDQLHPTTTSLYASLLIPLAVGVQALNAHQVFEREHRAYDAGYDAAHGETHGISLDQPRELRALLRGKSAQEIMLLSDVLRDYAHTLDAPRNGNLRHGAERPVHLVRDDESETMRRSN